jgi:hypothetical protein
MNRCGHDDVCNWFQLHQLVGYHNASIIANLNEYENLAITRHSLYTDASCYQSCLV